MKPSYSRDKRNKENHWNVALQRHTEWPKGKLLWSIFILTHLWLSTQLSSSSLHHLSHFSDLDCFSLWKSSLPIAGWGVRVWCLWFWVKQTAGFSHRVMEGVCLCSLLCVSEFVHCLGVSNLLTFPCAFWGHIHSELSVAALYDLLRAAEAADICACEDHVMRVNVGIKMNAFGHEGNLCFVSFYREITCNVTPRWLQSGRTFK